MGKWMLMPALGLLMVKGKIEIKYCTCTVNLSSGAEKGSEKQCQGKSNSPTGHLKCSAHSMFRLFPENRKSIPKFLSRQNFFQM